MLDVLHEKLSHLQPEQLRQVLELVEYLDQRPAGNIIAVNVSLEEYMEHYAADHCEWVEGFVIKMSPSELNHMKLLQYLYRLLEIYFEFRPIGQVISQPFVMRLPEFPKRRREPDLMVVLNNNPAELKTTYLDGPADICIEIILDESLERDKGEKFREYEQGKVQEYWLIDPARREAAFYRLNTKYQLQQVDEYGFYHTPLLPELRVHVPTLWTEPLPTTTVTLASIRAMLDES